MTEPTRSLHRKLAQIMYEAERIPKNGRAPAVMGGYPFVQVGDAADFIRRALAEKVITMMPTKVVIVGQAEHTTKAGSTQTIVDILTDWTLTDGESGESIVIQSFGAGGDAGDKYSGKAQTNAMKYALLMGFLLSTGDDPEADTTPERGKPKAVTSPKAQLARPAPEPVPLPNVAAADLAELRGAAHTNGRCASPGSGVAAGEACGLPAGHGGKLHRALDETGRVTASWPA